MSIFRSELMSCCQIFLPKESAYNTLAVLGEESLVEFRDLNPDVNSFQRTYVAEVRRCEELERRIEYILSEVKRDGLKLKEDWQTLPAAPNPREVAELEAQLERIETELREVSRNQVNLQTNYLELRELNSVLIHAHDFFAAQEMETMGVPKNMSIEERERSHLGFIAGVVNREKSFAFERMLWRIARGNVFLRRADLEEPVTDPITGNIIYKTVFMVFYQGEQLNTRIRKICSGFRASIYGCPGLQKEREEMLAGLKIRLADMKNVLQQAQDHRDTMLGGVCKELFFWTVMVQKMKSIYHTLNFFSTDVTQNSLVGQCWTPNRCLSQVQEILSSSSMASGSPFPAFLNVLNSKEEPPTYYPPNKFTRGFQNLIDAYGVASYREVNPALTSCITFPFLFSVMFGDLGHGLIIFLVGLWMVWDEKRLSAVRGGEIWSIMFAARYIMLLLGLFAMYTGLLYNELFSIAINIFGSTWRTNYNMTTVMTNPSGLTLNPTTDVNGVYPLGIDPIWMLASNEIIFTNSFKMKMSIIFAMMHMSLGLSMSVVNFVHFKKYAMIPLEFLPEILFLWLLFGYLAFLMFYKWILYTPFTTALPETPGCAPSLLIMFINMMLLTPNTPLPGCDANIFTIQPIIQHVFLIIAVLCIPWLLIGRPLWIQCVRRFRKKTTSNDDAIDVEMRRNKAGVELTIETAVESVESSGDIHDEEEPISEIWIHQAIHAIEYILSTISHTASYLRLWALSLAHSELSQVLWNMVMSKALTLDLGWAGFIAIYIIFAFWAVLTVAIMVMMEGLSAFLHTLRLHWVEFMSKFYGGEGYAFQPFSFKAILDKEED